MLNVLYRMLYFIKWFIYSITIYNLVHDEEEMSSFPSFDADAEAEVTCSTVVVPVAASSAIPPAVPFAYASSSKTRDFCATIILPADVDSIGAKVSCADVLQQLKDKTFCSYGLVAVEQCPSTNRYHLQMYFRFKNARSWNAVKKLEPFASMNAHIEVCKGRGDQNVTYCKKGTQPKVEWEESGALGPNYGSGAYFLEFGDEPIFKKHLKGMEYSLQVMFNMADELLTEHEYVTREQLVDELKVNILEMYDLIQVIDDL